ncbi:MAG: exsH [Phenylobacterium sp.]|nr:exsH [Phenylobacterium sp.]
MSLSAPGVTLTSSRYGDVLTGGAGADTLNAGQGPDKLTGGAGADTFAFKALPWNGGEITDFQLGVDRLDISALYVGGYAGADPVADGYVRFESNGAGGTKVMLDVDGAAAAHPWSYLIATLDGISPTGLTAAQVFGAPAPPVDPNAGLVLTSSHYADTLTGGAGADTLAGGQGPDKLIGGAGADTFVYKAMPWNGGEIADFQVGVDKLDVSALYTDGYHGTDPVADGYVHFESNGAGGTKVMLDVDGVGTANPFSHLVTTLDGVSPTGLTAAQVFGGTAATASAPAVTTPSTPGVALVSTAYGEALTGGAGADTLSAGQGPDSLTGGAGADHFVFAKLPWSAGHVTDFTPGADVLDLRQLFADAGYTGSNPLADGYLSFQSDGAGGTRVMFDPDGPGAATPWAWQVTTLDHAAPSSLSSSDWLFH